MAAATFNPDDADDRRRRTEALVTAAPHDDSADLVRRAEEKARTLEPQDLDDLSPEKTRMMLHELRIHQIELEMQNEELRRAQAEIEAARERYFDLYDLAPVGYCTLSEKGLILEANLTAATLLGADRGALLRQPLSRFILKEDQDRYYLHRKQLCESGALHACDLRMVKKDGTQFWAHLTSQGVTDGLVYRVALSDITVRKQTEKELELSRARFAWVMEKTGVGLWLNQLPLNRLNWDNQTRHLFFVPPEVEPTIDLFFSRLHPEDREPTRLAIEAAIRDHVLYAIDHRVINPDTEDVRWICSIGQVTYGADGSPIRFDGINYDITGRKQAEQALKEIARRKDEFIATLGHELRNPLAAISTALSLLEKQPTPERRQWSEAIILRQTRQLHRLVDDLLDLSRLTFGKIVLKKKRVEIGERMKMACRVLELSIAGEDLRLWTSPPSDPVFVSVDPVRLEQIFVNLLGNAAKFTPQGSTIWFSAQKIGETVVVRCRDNGIGIAQADISSIFEPFAQAPGEPCRGQVGLGIGLALVKNLVEIHGGSISAVSGGLGKGSEFIVILPVAETPLNEEEPVLVALSANSAAGKRKRRVLVAEDNTDLAQALRILLKTAGHEVSVVHDGNSAVSAACENHPEVMVIDIGLPGRDGYAVAAAVRNTPGLEKTLLIGVSGYRRDQTRAEDPFDHYLIKPVDEGTLLLLIEQSPERRSGGRSRPLGSVEQSGNSPEE